MERKDALTGLQVRESLELHLKMAISKEDGVALALLDIDHFMEINDTLGHESGDQVIRSVAELIRQSDTGTAYRVSGDEFAVLMPNTTLEQAFLRMEGLRSALSKAQEQYGVSGKNGIPDVSVTVGVAQFPRDAKDAQALLRAADAALRSAKEAGRNQVSLPPNEEMIMKSCYYSSTSINRLKTLADKLKKKESYLLREALTDLLHKYDRIEGN